MSEESLFGDVQPEIEDKLEALSKLVEEHKVLETIIESMEKELSNKKKELEHVSRELIPSILNSTGLSEIRLASGEKLEVEDKLQASISDKNYMPAYRNMIQAEGGNDEAQKRIDALFKSKVILEDASEILDVLLENDIPYEMKRSIHPQTLKKYCKSRLEEGKTIPEGISVFQYQETKIS